MELFKRCQRASEVDVQPSSHSGSLRTNATSTPENILVSKWRVIYLRSVIKQIVLAHIFEFSTPTTACGM